ncbi:MAG: phosphatidylglycerophosphatase [Blastocatellia bacterium]|jgi:phosphatidylglycerophosphatase A|nr:phosphatidylglycerophosphatase [Blastocatellia bacterium]
MTIKESSDELNAPAITAGASASDRGPRSVTDYLALLIATCGVGYLPIAPGTWGSLLAVGLYLLARASLFPFAPERHGGVGTHGFLAGELVVIVVVTFVGIWAASRTERVLRVKDPGKVVIDEVAGQLIALLPLGFFINRWWPIALIAAFLLFRLFDIIKPYPARKMESLKGGLGIMADDLVAGAYAAIGVALVIMIQRFIQKG